MASEDGAETAATIGIPAATAFWTISKDARPETRRIDSESGSAALLEQRARSTLSTALCLPMSSRENQRARRTA